jgi:hypothetical protein
MGAATTQMPAAMATAIAMRSAMLAGEFLMIETQSKSRAKLEIIGFSLARSLQDARTATNLSGRNAPLV